MTAGGEDSTQDDYTVVESTAIPEITQVRLYDETWDKIRRDHGEFQPGLPSQKAMIEGTAAKPTEVYTSNHPKPGSFIFVSTENTYQGNACTVVVRVVGDSTSARVQTAVFTDRPSGQKIWSANDGD